MKKLICLLSILLLLLCGCKSETQTKSNDQTTIDFDMFDNIVANNLFKDITAFEKRLLKTEISSVDKEKRTVTHLIKLMDLYGNTLAEHECSVDDAYHVTTLTATQDGGFLFVLGFRDHAYEQNVWASDKGFASRVIKCDATGKVQFDATFNEITGSALNYCFEKDEKFYLFGETETPHTKTRGVHSPTDIYMTVLDKKGNCLSTQLIKGSDYDSLASAEICDNGFLLSIESQSEDGDFIGSGSKGYPVEWIFTVNNNLEIIEKEMETGREYFDYKLGEKNRSPIYMSNTLFDNFDAGRPTAIINYDDFYLIVSEHNTGVYEKTPPYINSVWYYTETVYSAYDNSGNLLFRDSVDSTPDYDDMIVPMIETTILD